MTQVAVSSLDPDEVGDLTETRTVGSGGDDRAVPDGQSGGGDG